MNEVINIRDKNHRAVSESKASLFFYGDEGNPFLAPRGVYTVNSKFIVADKHEHSLAYGVGLVHALRVVAH